DPKISFGTLLGGNTYDFASDVAVDAKGNFYVVGYTEANTRFPGFGDGYVSKFSPTGALIYTTFLVGSFGEDARAIAVTPAGIAFVGGSTTSRDFPRVGAFQSTYAGDGDGYIVKLAVNGTIMKSSFIGGSGRDAVNGVRLGKGPNMTNGLYLIGTTESRNFPKKNALQQQYGGGRQDGFLSIIHSVQFQLLFSTYVGENATDDIKSLALINSGDLYALNVAPDSSLVSSIIHFIPQGSGTNMQYPARLVTDYRWEISPLGQALKFATLTEYNHQAAITAGLDPSSTNDIAALVLATVCIAQGSNCTDNGSLIFFNKDVTRISSINFGGTGPGAYFVNDIAIGKDGSIYMVGDTLIKNLPVVNPIQATNKGSWDGFILALTPGTFQPKFYSYLGAAAGDFALGVAVDNSGNILVAGSTESKQFPTTPNAPKKKPTGTGDGYVVKITP
ncbi:MAG TPA: SBBP repeat-containing protein, partial [Acidobacteriota bacterium]